MIKCLIRLMIYVHYKILKRNLLEPKGPFNVYVSFSQKPNTLLYITSGPEDLFREKEVTQSHYGANFSLRKRCLGRLGSGLKS